MMTLLVADSKGNFYEIPDTKAIGNRGYTKLVELDETPTVNIPSGGVLLYMPHRIPYGKVHNRVKLIEEFPFPAEGKHPNTLAVRLPPGYIRVLHPAYQSLPSAPPLPLFSYTAVGMEGDEIKASAILVEEGKTWDPTAYQSEKKLAKLIRYRLQQEPKNRLLIHLSRCALEYHCYNAQNIFYKRWEGGLPISPYCNANCGGCLSIGESSLGLHSPQKRIAFVPSKEEILSIALTHLCEGEQPILSFGQGCEGEPTIYGKLLEGVIRKIRQTTGNGIIHLNTNGSRPEVIEKLLEAGLDSVRISINSAKPTTYMDYVKPKNYSWKEVLEAISIVKDKGGNLYLNLLVFPGVTDREEEIEALLDLLGQHPVDMLQLRDLNIDPDIYFHLLPPPRSRIIGIDKFFLQIKREYPELKIGSFNPYFKR